MRMSKTGTPENLLDKDDPGDDTQRRFRYQATYAALKSLAMLEEEPEVAYIFCEHWEDVLVKRTDGQFIGIQIKTRSVGKDSFKTNDEEIINSLKRFIQLEKNFSKDFERYVIAASCGFWQERKNSSNLPYLLKITSEISSEEALSNSYLSQLLKKLLKIYKGEHSLIVETLKKVYLENAPGLEDVSPRLFQALACCSQVKHFSHQQILKIEEALIGAMLKAAALPKASPREEYLGLLKDPEQERANLTIQGKKITIEQILELVNLDISGVSDSQSTVLLTNYNHSPLAKLPKGMRKMNYPAASGRGIR
jgi:Cap4 dsDNA endonuclease